MDPRKQPFSVDELSTKCPAWPYKRWTTWRLIRDGHLKAICPPGGRRVFLTIEIVEAFLAENTRSHKRPAAKRAKTVRTETTAA